MNYAIVKTLIVLLIFMSSTVHSQPENGQVLFDFPNMPSPIFEFDLDRRVIELVMEDPNAQIAPLFSTIDNLRLHNYRSRSLNLKALVQYYSKTLNDRGWKMLGRRIRGKVRTRNMRLYILEKNQIVNGIFVIVNSKGNVYLINIVGKTPQKQLGDLLLNLRQLGIEIPALMSLKPHDLELPRRAPSPVLTSVKSPTVPSFTTDTHELLDPFLQKILDPTVSQNWSVDGKPIHGFQIQGNLTGLEGAAPVSLEDALAAEKANIMKVLENGSGDVAKVMPLLADVLLDTSKKVSLRVEEKAGKHIAIITVDDLPVTRTISVLNSLTISGANGKLTNKSVSNKLVQQNATSEAIPNSFFAADAPIHEIRIRGNQTVSEARIRQTLENGSEDIEQALKSLFKVMPYFKAINLQVNEENSKYIATITVDEKPLSTNAYLGPSPLLRLGFTRVTGWEIGTGFEVGMRKDIGRLWLWNVRNTELNQSPRLFGKVSYTFGNPHLHYRVGGAANWGEPYVWNLGLTAQIHRLTDVVAPEHFLDYNNGISIFQRIIGIPDLQNYYLRQGAEIALRWAPILPNHWFKLAMVVESHASLEKSTDWFIVNLRSSLNLRENPPITPGQMRGILFQYDFHNRRNSLGWHNTLRVEHSSPDVGSDFDFTRLQLHLRYAFPLGDNRIRTRFLFGFSDSRLPIQRQFVIGGMGGLRGYPWSRQENESDGIITYKSGHQSSPYAFTGDRGFLLNVEYHYRLSNLFSRSIFKNMFLIAFLDEGQVWNAADDPYTFDPKGNIGIGLQFGRDDAVTVVNINGMHSGRDDFIVRVNMAKALESHRGIQITTAWYQSF